MAGVCVGLGVGGLSCKANESVVRIFALPFPPPHTRTRAHTPSCHRNHNHDHALLHLLARIHRAYGVAQHRFVNGYLGRTTAWENGFVL